MDIKLDYGDFSITKVEESYDETKYYDLVIENEEEAITKLIRRTLETPLGHITQYLANNSIEVLDKDYGNPIYKRLGEVLTPSLLLEVNRDINTALSKITDIPNLRVDNIDITNVGLDSLTIEVTFTYNNKVSSSIFNLTA